MSQSIGSMFLDGQISQADAKEIFKRANPGHKLKKSDDPETLARNVAREIAEASDGKLTEADAMDVSQAIVRELFESTFKASGNKRFDIIKSPFLPRHFTFPEVSQQVKDELNEKEVANKVKDRDKPVKIESLKHDPAARKAFLERCTQVDGNTKTKWDRSACAIVSTLGGYVLADPGAFQDLGQALQKGPVAAIPGFAKYRDSHPHVKKALDAIANGTFSPMDVLRVAEALALTHGITGPDYAAGTDPGMSLYGAAVLVEQLTAAGAPPPDGLILTGIGSSHQIAKFGDTFFDTSAVPHSGGDFKPFHAAVGTDLTYARDGIAPVELTITNQGRTATFTHPGSSSPPTVMNLDAQGHYQVVSGTSVAGDNAMLAQARLTYK